MWVLPVSFHNPLLLTISMYHSTMVNSSLLAARVGCGTGYMRKLWQWVDVHRLGLAVIVGR